MNLAFQQCNGGFVQDHFEMRKKKKKTLCCLFMWFNFSLTGGVWFDHRQSHNPSPYRMCLYLSSQNEQGQVWPSSLSSSSSSFYNWLKLAQPSNLTVSLPCPGARPVLLTNYRCCLRWSVTPPASTELLSPLPFTWPINMPLRFHALVKKSLTQSKGLTEKWRPFKSLLQD